MWTIPEFENFLKDQEQRIKEHVSADLSKQIVDIVFQILYAELRVKMADEEERFVNSQKFDERGEFAKGNL